jgi:hypothetical protein
MKLYSLDSYDMMRFIMVNDSKSWDYPNQVSAAQKTALASTPNNLSLA